MGEQIPWMTKTFRFLVSLQANREQTMKQNWQYNIGRMGGIAFTCVKELNLERGTADSLNDGGLLQYYILSLIIGQEEEFKRKFQNQKEEDKEKADSLPVEATFYPF